MRILQSCFVLAAIFTAGCVDSPTPIAAVVAASNTNCPIMGHEVSDDGGRTEFNGQTIGFCCPGCIDKWNELSDEDKAEKLSAADSESDDHDNHESHTDHGGETEPGHTDDAGHEEPEAG